MKSAPHRIARSSLVYAALLSALAGSAIAQSTPAPATPAASADAPRHHGGRMDPAQRQARFEQRMAELKQKLQITGNQEAAWSSFTTALRPLAQRPRMDREALARMTTPDRIDHMRALRAERIAEMDRRGDATKAFYATLTAEQQKTFDEVSLHARGWGHKGRHRHG